MAIKAEKNNPESLVLNINNGELKALDQVKESWGFKDYESIIQYAIAVFKITGKGSLYTIKDGASRTLNPADELLISKSGSNEG